MTAEVLKAMLRTKLKIVTAMFLVVPALASVVAWQASTRADDRGRLDTGFRLAVNEVIADERTLVTQIEIEAPPRSKVEVIADKADRGGGSVGVPDQAAGPSRTQLTIFADHVEWKAGSTNAPKLMMKFKGSGLVSMSDTGPMPEGKKLKDLVKVAIKSGEYKHGESTKLVTFRDVTHSLVAKKSE
jgi:hypothetical protein